jgi:hypothetical protein
LSSSYSEAGIIGAAAGTSIVDVYWVDAKYPRVPRQEGGNGGPGLALLAWVRHGRSRHAGIMALDLTEDYKLALVALLTRTIAENRYP